MKVLIEKAGSWTANQIRKCDYFAHPVSLTIKGKRKFSTILGGLFTLCMISMLLTYGSILFVTLINKRDTIKSLSISHNDISETPDVYSINNSNFGFSFLFTKIILGYFSIISNLEIKKEAPFYDSSYFGLNFYQVKHSYSGSTSQVNYTDHGKTKCNLNVNQTQRTQAIKDFTYCAADDIFDVSGNSFSSEMRYVQMDFKKCKDSPSCQSDSTINSMLKNGQVYLNFKMNYFDFDDYLNPIKQVIDDRYMFRVIPGFQKIIYFYLQNNNVELRDGIVQINEVESHSFYSIGDVDQDFDTEESDGVILSIRIIQDDDVNNYERKVYSLLDMFGQIGGVYEIIRLIFEVLVGFFAKRIMMYTLFSYIYYVEDKNIKSVSANSELNQQVVYPKETLSKVNHQIFTQANNMKITKLNSVTKTKFHELESIQTPEISDRYENSDTFWRNVREKLKHRTHFNYTVKDYF